jgi:hypothetical protein
LASRVTASLATIAEALAAALAPIRAEIPDLQIYPYWLAAPTPPAVDIYPGDPFQAPAGFDPRRKALFWTVRARWTTADQDAGQQGLLGMLDPDGPASVEAAFYADTSLGGTVDQVAVVDESPTGYREYLADAAINGRLLGAEWRVEVLT